MSLPPLSAERRWWRRADSSLGSFRLFDINCLAPSLTDKTRYADHPPEIMKTSARLKAVLVEIEAQQPDIITMQEIEAPEFDKIRQTLGDHFDGFLVNHSGPTRIDGVATFWRKKRFRSLHSQAFVVPCRHLSDRALRSSIVVLEQCDDQIASNNQAIGISSEEKGDGASLNQRVSAKAVDARTRTEGADVKSGRSRLPERLIVANCHLVFNFSKSDVKVLQLASLIDRLHHLRFEWMSKRDEASSCEKVDGLSVTSIDNVNVRLPAVCIAGDLNLTPASPLYHWLTTGMPNAQLETLAADVCLHGPQGGRQITQRLISGQAAMFARNMSRAEIQRHMSGKMASVLLCSADVKDEDLGKNYLGDAGSVWGGQTGGSGVGMTEWLRLIADDDFNTDAFERQLLIETDERTSLDEIARSLNLSGAAELAEGLSDTASLFFLPLPLRSATAVTDNDKIYEPLMTVFQGKQIGTVDYILYSEDTLQVCQILAPAPSGRIRGFGPIPSVGYPHSDHFHVCVDLAFRNERRPCVLIRATEPLQCGARGSEQIAQKLAETYRSKFAAWRTAHSASRFQTS